MYWNVNILEMNICFWVTLIINKEVCKGKYLLSEDTEKQKLISAFEELILDNSLEE